MKELEIREEYEQKELINLRIEHKQLISMLEKRESELTKLKDQLKTFQTRYLQTVGELIAVHDEMDAQISEMLVALYPERQDFSTEADVRRKRAKSSREEASNENYIHEKKDISEPSNDLKKLFRDVARRVHPDLASDENDRKRRSELMKRANQAFTEQDIKQLEELLLDANLLETSSTLLSEQIRFIKKKIEHIKAKILDIDQNFSQLRSSFFYDLMQQTIIAQQEGRDLLLEMVDEIQMKINMKQERLKELKIIYEQKR